MLSLIKMLVIISSMWRSMTISLPLFFFKLFIRFWLIDNRFQIQKNRWQRRLTMWKLKPKTTSVGRSVRLWIRNWFFFFVRRFVFFWFSKERIIALWNSSMRLRLCICVFVRVSLNDTRYRSWKLIISGLLFFPAVFFYSLSTTVFGFIVH